MRFNIKHGLLPQVHYRTHLHHGGFDGYFHPARTHPFRGHRSAAGNLLKKIHVIEAAMLDWSQHTYQTLQAALLLMLKIFIAIAICILVNWQISSDMQSGVGTSDDEDEFVVLADVLGLRHSVNINIDNK